MSPKPDQPQNYGLALDTTSANLSIALSNFDKDNRSQTWHLGRDLSLQLHVHLQEILRPQTWSDLQFIAVAKGPGSFTSIRIGVVTARVIAQQLQIPVYGISNLVAIASKISINLPENKLIAIQMDTKREQVFCGIYRFTRSGEFTIELDDSTMSKQQWLDQLNHLEQQYELHHADQDNTNITESLLEIGKLRYLQDQTQIKHNKSEAPPKINNWAKVIPFYGQNPVN